MARPQRNNVDYFPFLCEDGNKMFYLEETYGNDGFAVFVKLLRELAKTDFHYLDLSKKPTIMFLSAKCKVDSNTLISIIKDLVELEKFDSELWNENSVVWCQDFIDSIQDAYGKRSNKCIDRNSLLLLLEGKGIRKQSKSIPKPSKSNSEVSVNPQSIVKDSKLKDNILGRKLTFSQSTSKLFDSEFPNDKHHLDDFVEYWTEHGDKDKKMRFEKQKSFSTTRRVKTWIKNNFNNNNYGDKQQNKQTAISIGLNNPNL